MSGLGEVMRPGESEPIYLDGFSSMPMIPEAFSEMVAALRSGGNAGSGHVVGERAAQLVADARASVAELIGAAPTELVFTSGATEANNLALFGVASASVGSRNRIVISGVEHKSVIEPAAALSRRGFAVSRAPVDCYGRVDLDALAKLMDDDVLLVSVMAANNETGVVQPIREIASLAHQVGALMHCDGAQAIGKIPLDVIGLDVDYLSISAHKCYGPQGVGALYISALAPRPEPILYGGGQEKGLRSGTEPVALIAGFGAAARCARLSMPANDLRARSMVKLLSQKLSDLGVQFSAVAGDRSVLPGSFVVRLLGADGESLCRAVGSELCISTGSACQSGQISLSHVFENMGYSQMEASEVVRIFCPHTIAEDDIVRAANLISGGIARLV